MKKRKVGLSTVLLVFMLLVGLSVMLYPAFSDWYNSQLQGKAIADYERVISEMTDSREAEILERARAYNRELAKTPDPIVNSDAVPGYEGILDITGTGIMGYVSIPQIGVQLPIYHGTSEGVLEIAVGHLKGTSLPVGGKDTHAVISAHTGLPSAKLFTDLDRLTEGDTFSVTVLKETFTYMVDDIYVVLPNETEKLAIMPGRDLITLTTCTPYGINTHRLLVRGRRVSGQGDPAEDEGIYQEIKVTAEAVQVDSVTVIEYISAPVLLILLIKWLFGAEKKTDFPHGDPLSVLGGGNEQTNEAGDRE